MHLQTTPVTCLHLPGPKHVLEIANELELSPSQLASTKALYEEMRRNAVALGEDLLIAECSTQSRWKSENPPLTELTSRYFSLIEMQRLHFPRQCVPAPTE